MNEEKSINLKDNLKNFPVILESVTSIAPYVKHFVFRYAKDDFTYIAGQFITIHFEKDGKMLRRSYSVACTPEYSTENKTIEFAAGYVKEGPASELLFNLKPGDSLSISGPFGRLILKEGIDIQQPKRYIFVSTSTGVTPFRAMLKTLSDRFVTHPDTQVILLEGVQYRQDILYNDDFLSFAEKYPQFTFHACYSREGTSDLKPHEHSGYVQSLFPSLHVNPDEDIVYLCGNPSMVDESFLYFKEAGFEVKNIFREKYISSK